MANGKQLLQQKTINALTKEAVRVKEDLKGYLEDLELYSKPGFWEAVRETQENKGKRFSSVKALFKELDG